MSATGALGTKLYISPVRPTARTQTGYEALDTRSITPSALASNVFTIPAADYAVIYTGDPVTLSAALAPLLAGTTYYIIKTATANEVSLAATLGEARAGTVLDITGTLAAQTLDLSNWKLAGELSSLDEFGRQYEVVRANNLADGATRKSKGSFDQGSVPIELIYDSRDSGQVVLEEALRATPTYAFRVDLPVDDAALDGAQYYFTALVTNLRPRVGGPNDIVMMRGNLEIDHNDPVIA